MNDRESATVLGALRLWQTVAHQPPLRFEQIATNDGAFRPLDDEEIDGLCERLNVGPTCPFCRDGVIDGEVYERIVGALGRNAIEATLEEIYPYQEPELCRCGKGVSDCATEGCCDGGGEEGE